MRQFIAITWNAFMELIRQPIFLLLMTCSALFMVFLSTVPYFGFGEDPKLVKDSVLAVMLLAGLFGAVINAAATVAHEVRSGTALAVLSKPISRLQFLLAKFLGVAAALTLLTFVNTVAALLAGQMAFDAYGSANVQAFGVFSAGLVAGYLIGGFSNFFLRRPFVSDAVFSVVIMVVVAFVVINLLEQREHPEQGFAAGVDWKMVPAAILVLFALWILSGLAIACSTRMELIPTLSICTGLFLLGLMSDYLFGQQAREGSGWASVLYTVLPNWQLFWLADALEKPEGIPWSYVGKALGYVAGYLGACLALALVLFEDRELN